MTHANDKNLPPLSSHGLRVTTPQPTALSQSRRWSSPIFNTPDINSPQIAQEPHGTFENTIKPARLRVSIATPTETHPGHDHRKWKSLFTFTTQRHTPILLLSIIFSVLVGLVPPLQSYLLGRVFASFAQFGAGKLPDIGFKQDLARYNIYYVLLGCSYWLLSSSAFAGWVIFGELQARSAREQLFHGLLRQPVSWFDQSKDGIGALVIQLQGSIKDLDSATAQPLGMTIRDLTTAIGSFGLALCESWKLTLVIMSSIPIIAILVPLISSRIQQNIDLQAVHMSEVAKHVTNALSSIETVKVYNGQRQELSMYSSLLKKAARYYHHQINWDALQSSVLRFITLAIFVQGFWYGSTLIDKSATSAGSIFTAFWSCLIATSSLMQVMPQLIFFEKGKAAGHQLRSAIYAETKATENSQRRSPSRVGDIIFRKVWFSYPSQPHQMALRGVTFFFAAERFTFVVGKSGCGKSTIGQILMQFYPPARGIVTLNNVSLQLIDPLWIRRNILLVEQQSVLFNTTIRTNIATGREDYTSIASEEIDRATELPSLLDWLVQMPEGFETNVGSKGVALSGGQIQRVALARARLRDPPVLILDEATSALDPISRVAVMDAIRRWRHGKTTIIITHDISQIHSDDFVYVMNEGKVVQEGFRKTLAKVEGSLFQEFVKSPSPPVRSVGHAQDAVHFPHDDTVTMPRPLLSHFSAVIMKFEQSQVREGSQSSLPRNSGSPTITPRPSKYDNAGGQFIFQQTRPISRLRYTAPTEISKHRLHAHSRVSWYEDNCKLRGSISEGTELSDLGEHTQAEKQRPVKYTMKDILATVWPNLRVPDRLRLLCGFAAALIYAASTPMFALVFSKLIATLYNPVDRKSKALKYSSVILAMAAGDSLSLFLGLSLVQRAGQAWINSLRVKALKQILDQPQEFFDHMENGASQMVQCLDHRAEEMQQLISRFAGNMLVVITMMTTAIVWGLICCWKLTLVIIACTPIVLLVIRALSSISGAMENQSANEEEHAASIFAEAFTNIKTVKTLTLENYFLSKHQLAAEAVFRTGIKKGVYVGIFHGLSQAILLFITALIFHYGGVLLRSHQFGFNSIVQVFILLLLSLSTAAIAMASMPRMSASQESATRLLRLVNLPKSSHERYGSTQLHSVGDIVFHDVKFYYPGRPDQLILNGFDMSIKAGSCVALVGASGSGKSTVTSLLLKLYSNSKQIKPIEDITVSGYDIKSIHTSTLRNLITVVSQTPALFPTSISANIVYGLRKGNELNCAENVRAAAIGAGIHDFICTLPNGYDTLIGEGGMGLSGGQAQRIAIARALARRPNVLILDEATSALDQESVNGICKSIQRLVLGGRAQDGRSMTVIIVTHSRDMMKIADNIVMIDKGVVVEQGFYEQLCRRNGKFASMLRGEV